MYCADIGTRWGAPKPSVLRFATVIPVFSVFLVSAVSNVVPSGLVQPLLNSDFIWPTVSEICDLQAQFIHNNSVPPSLVENDGLFLTTDGKIWIPPTYSDLKLRILIVAHCGSAGHRGISATANSIHKRFYWKNMIDDCSAFCRQCLHCTVNRGGNVVPRPFGRAIHASSPNMVLHFDYLQIGLSSKTNFKYLFVVRDDLSSFVDFYPCSEPTAAFAAGSLLDWISRYGLPSIFVSDRGSHFLNSLIEQLSLSLHIQHHFTLAYCPWSNGTVEVVNSYILSVLRSLISEFRLNLSDWPILLPLVRFALNHTIPPNRPAAITLFTGLSPSSALDLIWNPKSKTLLPTPMSFAQLSDMISDLRKSLDDMHKNIENQRELRRNRQNARRKAVLPNFSVGDFVLLANTSKIQDHKLRVRWTGPCRITAVLSDYIFTVEDLITKKTSDFHASRLRFYSDSSLNITEDILAQVAHDGYGFEIEDLIDARWNSKKKIWEILVKWQGLQPIQDSWEPLPQLLQDAPVFVRRQLKKSSFCSPSLLNALLTEGGDGMRRSGRV